jgi:hypothetical protein
MKFILSFCFLFLASLLLAQEAKIDSLLTIIENHKKKSDTTRVKLLNELSKYYTTTDASKNEPILLEAIE